MSAVTPQETYLNSVAMIEDKGERPSLSKQVHGGSIIESVLRRRGHNLSKLALHMNVSRCTLYNWFQKDKLPLSVLLKIGTFINHDFAEEFPDIFSGNDVVEEDIDLHHNMSVEQMDAGHWMRKYIDLLEKYNESLLRKNSH